MRRGGESRSLEWKGDGTLSIGPGVDVDLPRCLDPGAIQVLWALSNCRFKAPHPYHG